MSDNTETVIMIASDSLVPDSLVPDSLAPDSLVPDSLVPDSLAPVPVFVPITIESQFTTLLSDLTSLKNKINEMQTNVRLLEKTVIKNNKEKEKYIKKSEIKIQPPPSGFDIPVKLSVELCRFMNKSVGGTASRPDVADYVINYISNHKLQDMTNRKRINLDESLRNLLKPNDEEEVTYFNLQKHLNAHFI